MNFMTRSKLAFIGCTLVVDREYNICSPDLFALLRKRESVPVYHLCEIAGHAQMTGKKLNVHVDGITHQFRKSCVNGLMHGLANEVFGQAVPV